MQQSFAGAEALYSPELSSANTETGEMYGTHESGKLSRIPYTHNTRFRTTHHTCNYYIIQLNFQDILLNHNIYTNQLLFSICICTHG
jgi:hypothetical protein